MKINALTAIASVVVAGAAIYGFAASGVIQTNASTGTDGENTKPACSSMKADKSNHMAAVSIDSAETKVCEGSEDLLLMDDVEKDGKDCGSCPMSEDGYVEEQIMLMDDTEHCEGDVKVCPSTEDKS